MADASPARDVFVTGLKNAHAMENQALSIMRPQVERLEQVFKVPVRVQPHPLHDCPLVLS